MQQSLLELDKLIDEHVAWIEFDLSPSSNTLLKLAILLLVYHSVRICILFLLLFIICFRLLYHVNNYFLSLKKPGPSCSKLTMSLVNDSLKFTLSDTQIC